MDAEFIQSDAGSVVIRADRRVYGLVSILKAAHKFSGRCFVHLEHEGDSHVLCRLRVKRSLDNVAELAGEFANELLDQRLRGELAAATEPIRNLILAQAFSSVNLIRPDLDTAAPDADPCEIGRPDDKPN